MNTNYTQRMDAYRDQLRHNIKSLEQDIENDKERIRINENMLALVKLALTSSEYKRFMCFGFADFYPQGGLGDVYESFDTEEEAAQWLGTKGYEHNYAYVFDRIEAKTYNIVVDGKLSNP